MKIIWESSTILCITEVKHLMLNSCYVTLSLQLAWYALTTKYERAYAYVGELESQGNKNFNANFVHTSIYMALA